MVFDSEHNTAYDKDKEQYVKVTTISFSIGRGETVCFTVKDNDQVRTFPILVRSEVIYILK